MTTSDNTSQVPNTTSVEETDESPKTNFAAKAVGAVTKFVSDHPLIVWGSVAVIAGAVAVAVAPKEKIVDALEDDSVEITTIEDGDGNLVTTIVEAAPEETSSDEE